MLTSNCRCTRWASDKAVAHSPQFPHCSPGQPDSCRLSWSRRSGRLMYGVGVRDVHNERHEALNRISYQTISVGLLAYRTRNTRNPFETSTFVVPQPIPVETPVTDNLCCSPSVFSPYCRVYYRPCDGNGGLAFILFAGLLWHDPSFAMGCWPAVRTTGPL